jgi:hypothetical protein
MIYCGVIIDMMDNDSSTMLNMALERVRSELGREVTPKDLAYYIGGEPSQWGRILKGATIRSDYLYRLKLLKNHGTKYAAAMLGDSETCPNKYPFSCENCRRKICYGKRQNIECLERESKFGKKSWAESDIFLAKIFCRSVCSNTILDACKKCTTKLCFVRADLIKKNKGENSRQVAF